MPNTSSGTLITRALNHLSRISTGTTRSGGTMETEGISWLNTAMNRMSRYYDFREMHKQYTDATVADAKLYTLPTNWKIIQNIRLINGTQSITLKKYQARRFDKSFPYPEGDSTDQPVWYIPWGNEFEIYPIPDAAYTINMKTIQWPTVIADTSTLIDFEPNKDDVVLAFMIAEGFRFLQTYTDATEWENTAKLKLRESIRLELNDPDWEPIPRGFNSGQHNSPLGDYYNNPWVYTNP